MSELSKSPSEIFTPNTPCVEFENINGYDLPVLELSDKHGNYVAIPALYNETSDICGKFIHGHFITEVDYDTYNGEVAIIKAYY